MACSRIGICLLFSGVTAAAAIALRPVPAPQGMPTTEQHQFVQQGVGEWEGTLQMLTPGTSADPVPATETVEPVGQIWTQSHFECEFQGMPFEGRACLGYDPAKKKFVSTWIDNMTPFLVVMEGDRDPKTGMLKMHWDAPDMMTGQMTPHRSELVFSGDSYTTTFFMGEGEGTKTMVISMKRKATGEMKGE